MTWSWFPYINLICALLAAALWYVFPQLMVWPLLLGLLPWLLRLGHEGRWRWRTPFDWPFLLFLLTGLVSLWAAYNPQLAWGKFWTIVAGMLLFYALGAFFLPDAPDNQVAKNIPAWFMAVFGAVVSIYFIATHNWDDFNIKYAGLVSLGRYLQGFFPTLPGHRLHPNVVGGILAMMIPFSAAVSWQAIKERRWLSIFMGLLLLGVALLGLLLSSSRGSWLALGAAAGLALLWGLSGLLSSQKPERRRILFLAVMLLLFLTAGIGLLLQPGLFTRSLDNLPALAGGTNRLDLYRNSLVLVQDYPFIGSGLGGFMMLYSTYAYALHVGFIIHAHNIYLDVAIEQGLFALLALIWMWVIFGVALWRELGNGRLRLWLGAAALSLVTILLHGLVEDALYGSRSLMLLFLPLAFALPYPRRKDIAARAPSRLVLAIGIFLLSIILLFGWRSLGAAAFANWAAVDQSRSELSQYKWPDWPIQDALRRDLDLSRPIANYARALALNPRNSTANRRLGQIMLSQGAYEQALVHLLMAYKTTPWDNATRQFLGEAYLVNGYVDEGLELWRTVNNAQNQLGIRAYWYGYIGEESTQKRMEELIDGLSS